MKLALFYCLSCIGIIVFSLLLPVFEDEGRFFTGLALSFLVGCNLTVIGYLWWKGRKRLKAMKKEGDVNNL